MERHTEADCSIQEHPAFCFCTKSNGKPISGYPAQSRQLMVDQSLIEKISQYRTDGRNLFSYTEKIMVAMMCPDMYLELMPDEYLDRPLFAYFKVLDSDQRSVAQVRTRNRQGAMGGMMTDDAKIKRGRAF